MGTTIGPERNNKMKTKIKNMVSGFSANKKLALVNLHNDKVTGWIHAGCAKKIHDVELIGEWQAIPVNSLEKKPQSYEPCGICCENNYSEYETKMEMIASELCK